MEKIVFLLSSGSLAVYFFIQVYFLRSIQPLISLSWQKKVVVVGSISSIIFSAFVLYTLAFSLLEIVVGTMYIAMFFLGTAILYLLTIYSFLESSITVKLFSLIAKEGEKGISIRELKKSYGLHAIVNRRLERLHTVGTVRIENDIVYLKKPNTMFVLRAKIHQILDIFFPS